MHFAKKLFLLILLFSTQLLHAEPLKGSKVSPLVAVGQAGFPAGEEPLILVSENEGERWSYVPSPEPIGRFVAVSCNGNQCTAIGDGGFDDFPAIYTSSDAKHSWQVNKNISGIPQEISKIRLSNLACVNNVCIAVGDAAILPRNESVFPIILRSEDSGKTWRYVPNLYPRSFLCHNVQISCSGANCAIVGTAWKNEIYYPYILMSHDSGRSWAVITKIADLPINQHNMLLNVNCDASNCVAVGIQANLITHEMKPLFIYSNDAGKSWSFSKDVESNNGKGVVSVNCTGSFCIAGGVVAFTKSSKNNSMLWISRDSGKSWTSPSINKLFTLVNSVRCDDSSCIALNTFPAFVLTSQDKGLSWKEAEISDPFHLMKYASLSSLSCTGNVCSITGEYYLMGIGIVRPFFLLSHDHGMTWRFNQNIDGLPASELNFFPINLTGSRGEFPIHIFGPFKSEKDWVKRLSSLVKFQSCY